MALVKTSAIFVAVFAVAVQWLDQSGKSDHIAGGIFATPVHAARLTRFYLQHAPDKVHSVPDVLERYAGREDELYRKLAGKYGVSEQWRVDALSALRAALEMMAHKATLLSPFAADGIGRLRSETKGARAWRACLMIVALAFLAVPPPGSPRARLRALCYIVPLVTAAFYGPGPSSFSIKAAIDGVADLMSRNDATGRLCLVGAATAFGACLRPRAAPVLALGALAALAVSNPANEVSNDVDAGLLVAAGVAAGRLIHPRHDAGPIPPPRLQSRVRRRALAPRVLDGPGAGAGRGRQVVPPGLGARRRRDAGSARVGVSAVPRGGGAGLRGVGGLDVLRRAALGVRLTPSSAHRRGIVPGPRPLDGLGSPLVVAMCFLIRT